MKKGTKISLRTKIYLTIIALLALTGVFYASNPSVFVMPGHGVFQPISPAVDPTHFYVSQYQDGNVKSVDCFGMGSLFGTISGGNELIEKHMAFAPAQSVAAGFTPGDLFVTFGEQVFRAVPPVGVFMPFADWSGVNGGCPGSHHSAITFDKVGTFGNKMIITCEQGRLFTVDGTGVVTHLADTTTPGHQTFIEGPAVVPLSFGPLSGQILVADDQYHNIYAIDNLGHVNYDPFGFPGVFTGAEQVLVIPEDPCVYCGDHAFFTASAENDNITSYPRSDFDGLGGDILVTTELNPNFGTFRVHFDVPSQTYQFSVFDANAILSEGSNFVEGVCSPTPTPTATATAAATATATAAFTPTPTATFTPTPTATATATAALTPTPTATATATATFTPTPTATFTPTPTATATFTPTPTPTPTPQGHISQITHTSTTCAQFVNGTGEILSNLNYSVSNGRNFKVKNVTPGVFFYWVSVTVPAGNNSFTITQTITTGNFTGLFDITPSNVFDSTCTNLPSASITQNPITGAVTAQWNAPTAGTYIISIKYDSKSIQGDPAPSPGTTVHYDFATTGVPGSTSGLDLVLQSQHHRH